MCATPTPESVVAVAVLADVEGMASVCERLPNIDFVDVHGLTRGRPHGCGRPRVGRGERRPGRTSR